MNPDQKDNLTAVLHGINDLRLEQRPIPIPKNNQVLLQMEVVGICGSDVHYLTHGSIGPFVLEKPMVIGHEAAGTVVQCGKDVKNLQPGDRVAIEPGVPCRCCEYCKTGSYHLCPDMAFCATPPFDGNLARYYVHDADFCFKLPCNMDFEHGALMEPLSVAVHACRRANVQIGDYCIIFGAGPIGLVTLMTVKAMGASKVCICEVRDFRLKKAKELGADYCINIKGMEENVIVNKLKNLMGSEPQCCFDAAGATQCVRIACQVTRANGKVILIGMSEFEMNIPLSAAICKEVDIRGIFRYVNCYPTAIEMIKTGKVNVKSMVTHHFKLEDTIQAFETHKNQLGDPIKIMIHTNSTWKPQQT